MAGSQPISTVEPLQTDLYKEALEYLPIQRKLSIGAVEDTLEDEVAAMADKVMRILE